VELFGPVELSSPEPRRNTSKEIFEPPESGKIFPLYFRLVAGFGEKWKWSGKIFPLLTRRSSMTVRLEGYFGPGSF
jgi:hypothetical protein